MRQARIFSVALLAPLCTLAPAEDKIPVDQIPGHFVEEIKSTMPGARIISAEKRANNTYNIEVQQGGLISHVNIGGGIARSQTFDSGNIPSFYTDLVKRRFPDAKIIRVAVFADSSLQDAALIDLVDLKDNGRNVRVAMGLGGGPAGGIWTITKDFAPSELPDAVTKSILAKYPAAQITSASEELSAANTLYSYDVTLRPATGKPRGLSCGPKGEIDRDYQLPAGPKAPTTAPATRDARL